MGHTSTTFLYQIPVSLSAHPCIHHIITNSIPIATPDDLVSADGIMFGIPTRFGRAPAQVSAFFDATGGLWAKVGYFTNTCHRLLMPVEMISTSPQRMYLSTSALTITTFSPLHTRLLWLASPQVSFLARAHKELDKKVPS